MNEDRLESAGATSPSAVNTRRGHDASHNSSFFSWNLVTLQQLVLSPLVSDAAMLTYRAIALTWTAVLFFWGIGRYDIPQASQWLIDEMNFAQVLAAIYFAVMVYLQLSSWKTLGSSTRNGQLPVDLGSPMLVQLCYMLYHAATSLWIALLLIYLFGQRPSVNVVHPDLEGPVPMFLTLNLCGMTSSLLCLDSLLSSMELVPSHFLFSFGALFCFQLVRDVITRSLSISSLLMFAGQCLVLAVGCCFVYLLFSLRDRARGRKLEQPL